MGQSEFRLVDHTADFGFTVRSPDLASLYRDAACFMLRTMVSPLDEGAGRDSRLEVSASDPEDLMVRWLGEILYHFQGEGEIMTAAEMDEITATHLSATVRFIPFDALVHEILLDIKAVTYHQIEVARKKDYWEARIIFDV